LDKFLDFEGSCKAIYRSKKKAGNYNFNPSDLNGSEYEKEVKFLVFKPKNFAPVLVWSDKEEQMAEQRNRRWRLTLPLLNG
jgi:hypothetical protein